MVEYAQCPECKRVVLKDEIIVVGDSAKKDGRQSFLDKIAGKLFVEKEVIMCKKCVESHNNNIGSKK